MDYQKIINLLDTASHVVPRFITKEWIEVYDQSYNSEDGYKLKKQIRFKILMLQSDLYDYSNAYIVVKETINVTDPNSYAYDKKLAFKNKVPFISCISKINYTLIDNADLDIVTPMYNLIEYSKNYPKTTGSSCNCYKDEPNSRAVGNTNNSVRYSKYFDYKTSITERLEGNSKEKKSKLLCY